MTIRKSSSPGVASVTGNSGKYLTTDGVGTSWGTITFPASGGMTSLASGSLAASATGVDLQSISSDYNELVLYVNGWSLTSSSQRLYVTLNNNNSGSNYAYQRMATNNTSVTNNTAQNQFDITNTTSTSGNTDSTVIIRLSNYKNTTALKVLQSYATDSASAIYYVFGVFNSTAAINRITLFAGGGSFDAGTYELFGVK